MYIPYQSRSLSCFNLFILLGALTRGANAAPTTSGDSPSPFNAADDGIIADKSAGLGIELESSSVLLKSATCKDDAKSNLLKAKTLGGRTGTNWELTVDTTIQGSTLTAEYILDGTKLKLNAGTVAKAAAAVAEDMVKWKPKVGDSMNIVTDTFKDWKISSAPADMSTSIWAIQATAPMPLAGINDLFELAAKGQTSKSVLLSSSSTKNKPLVWVTEDFFKLKPQGNSGLNKNALGFLSMLMTYVKGVDKINSLMKSDQSPKMLTSIMPRTYFTTMFDLVKSDLKFTSTTTGLYDLVKILSCYEVYWDDAVDVIVDTAYCKQEGTKSPEPIAGKLDNAAFEFPASGSVPKKSIKLQDWVNGIQTSKKTQADLLSTADKDFFDGQIGGLKDGIEYVLGTKTEAALFEFRDLNGIKPSQIEAQAVALEKAVVALHQTYAKTS